MSVIARQSTAFETAIGPVLDADGVAVTDCVVGDLKLKKTSGNFAALNGSATLTHVSAGMYDLVLTTSDTDTVGVCCVAIDDTTNACAPLYLQVVEEAIFDALFAASGTGALPVSSGGIAAAAFAAGAIDAAAIATGAIDADAIADNAIDAGAIAADAITSAKIADNAIAAAKIATGAITSAKFAAGAIDAAAIANGAIDAATFAADVDAEILSYLVDDATRIDASALNTATGTTIPAIQARLKWVVIVEGTIGATGNDTTHVHLPGLTYGNDEINGYMLVLFDVSTSEYHWREITDWVLATELATVSTLPFTPQNSTDTYAILAMLANASVTGGDATAANQTTIINHLTDIKGGTFSGATDSLEAIRDNTGTAGAGLTAADDAVISAIAALNNLSSAQAQTAAAAALTAYDPPTNAEMEARTLVAADYATAANLATVDNVVDAILADTGTDGVVLSTATQQAIADALLDRTAGVETNRTLRQSLRLILATAVGKLSGAATSTVLIRDTNDSKNRVSATVDADGNRSAVTLDAT